MVLVAVFGVALLVAVLVSGLAARSVLSTSLLFLLAGAVVGDGALGLVHIAPDSSLVTATADLALFTVLFTDGMHVSFPSLRSAWRHPARALGIGMPLAFGGVAVLTHYLVGLDWTTSLLVGAVLSPTDPVFASAIVGRKEVPARLRQLLNVESGLNDGLALPVVLVLITAAGPLHAEGSGSLGVVGLELAGGLALGVVVPLLVTAVVRLPGLGAEPRLQPLGPLAIGIVLYAACHLTGANPYLAAFAAGAVLASAAPQTTHAFEALGEALAELSKFAALLVFGALLTPALFGSLSVGGYVVVVLAIVLIRPASLLIALLGTRIDRRERWVAAWFGPKGFASVVYGLLVLQAGIPHGEQAYTLIAVCIAVSIAVHSSSDVPIARLFHVDDLIGIPDDEDDITADVVEGRNPQPPLPSQAADPAPRPAGADTSQDKESRRART
ncbi:MULTISPECIES: cation:proton antiporter [unclassified Streptomyces]|uniref:cation:proton antiporter n=1 Tax=unclassified Streptomyces TaxID=2593676 RepID=UPI0022AE8EFB|nr:MULTISPECIES: cation:proton antiporter [unclassified Streptomyces]MCZ4123919.1 cation:proton antiporter [Streptomyces sp. H39-S7]MDF9814204.1 NhaP-type Na+/H+ or K+/H+ antiporter [Streptomyces sp. SPB162]